MREQSFSLGSEGESRGGRGKGKREGGREGESAESFKGLGRQVGRLGGRAVVSVGGWAGAGGYRQRGKGEGAEGEEGEEREGQQSASREGWVVGWEGGRAFSLVSGWVVGRPGERDPSCCPLSALCLLSAAGFCWLFASDGSVFDCLALDASWCLCLAF